MFESDFLRYTLTPILAILGSCLGVFAAILGGWNWWLNRKAHKVSVDVEVSDVEAVDEERVGEKQTAVPTFIRMQIRAINNSYFDVTVAEVGIVSRGSWPWRKTLVPLYDGRLDGPQERRILKRDKFDFTLEIDPVDACNLGSTSESPLVRALIDHDWSEPGVARCVYAKLVTDEVFYGGKKELPGIIKVFTEYVLACSR